VTPGTLTGVGVGPGDPGLITLKAVDVLRRADRVFVPDGGRAEAIVAAHVEPDRLERLTFAMTDVPARAANWDRAGAAIEPVLAAGGHAAFATIGDPNLYSTFTYVAQTLRNLRTDLTVRTVPGITAMQDLAARSGTVLAEGTERLALMPYTAGDDLLREALASFDTVVVYKGGRRLPEVLRAVDDAGRLDDSVYGEQLGLPDEAIHRARDLNGDAGPYMSTIVVPARRGERGGRL
jgi:precorrin-2/cobalt-factor-2 C20-methyltransferase